LERQYHQLSGEKTELACLDQILENFMSKNCALLRALLKIINLFVYNSGAGRDILKLSTDLDSAGQKQFSE
jgi:hypothetical protein